MSTLEFTSDGDFGETNVTGAYDLTGFSPPDHKVTFFIDWSGGYSGTQLALVAHDLVDNTYRSFERDSGSLITWYDAGWKLDYSDNTAGVNLTGGGWGDVLIGGSGPDTLFGRTGDDTLVSTGDGDRLRGGQGDDTFQIDGLHTGMSAAIASLSAHDVVDLSGAAQSLGLPLFIEVSRFDHHAGEVMAVLHNQHTTLLFDLDGNGARDHRIIIRGDETDFSHIIGVAVLDPAPHDLAV